MVHQVIMIKDGQIRRITGMRSGFRRQNWRICRMQRILSKRVLRDIRENLLRYLALFFLVALVMYMVVAIVGAAETIMQGTKESGRVHHIEDGQFGVLFR